MEEVIARTFATRHELEAYAVYIANFLNALVLVEVNGVPSNLGRASLFPGYYGLTAAAL